MTKWFESIDTALPTLASEIMHEGDEVGSRLGERTMELLHEQIVLKMPWKREVLVKGRNANIVAQIAETMWVLAGRNDVEFLGHYLARAKNFSDDGKTWRGGYGPRLRGWEDLSTSDDTHIDQIRHVLDLLNEDRTSRRAVAAIYDPEIDTAPGKDIPCNDFLSFIGRKGRLDMSVFVRSNDLVWGWSGINAFEWSALQEIMAGILGLEVGHLVFNTTSLHIYDRHWPKADRMTQNPLARGFEDSPRFDGSVVRSEDSANTHPIERLDQLIAQWFRLEERIRTTAGAGVRKSEVDNFPEPLMRSWLRVIAWYWSGRDWNLEPLEGTRLWAATQEVPQFVKEHVEAQKIKAVDGGKDWGPHEGVDLLPVPSAPVHVDPFIEYVDNLHREKSAAYGDSWKKRGEQMSILANIARKVDRLGNGTETADETQADTAVDLLVYLVKYRLWLSETNPELSLPMLNAGDENDNVRAMLEWLSGVARKEVTPKELKRSLEFLHDRFAHLEEVVTTDPHRQRDDRRAGVLTSLLLSAYLVARRRWEIAQHG